MSTPRAFRDDYDPPAADRPSPSDVPSEYGTVLCSGLLYPGSYYDQPEYCENEVAELGDLCERCER